MVVIMKIIINLLPALQFSTQLHQSMCLYTFDTLFYTIPVLFTSKLVNLYRSKAASAGRVSTAKRTKRFPRTASKTNGLHSRGIISFLQFVNQ